VTSWVTTSSPFCLDGSVWYRPYFASQW